MGADGHPNKAAWNYLWKAVVIRKDPWGLEESKDHPGLQKSQPHLGPQEADVVPHSGGHLYPQRWQKGNQEDVMKIP